MECNFLMERLLMGLHMNEIEPTGKPQVWMARNLDGDPFWCAGDFCGLDTSRVIRYGRELTDLEWDGNELFACGEQAPEQAAAIYCSLKMQLQQNYPDTEFDLMMSVGSDRQSAVVRFWAVRDGYHYIDGSRENLERFKDEAVLFETVNRVQIKQEADRFIASFSNCSVEVCRRPDQIAVILKNPKAGEDLTVYFEDEMTMVFSRYHAHYPYGEERELREDIDGILSGDYAASCIESSGRWLGSGLAVPEEIPVDSRKKLLKYLFGGDRGRFREVKENGGCYSLTFWDPEQNRRYRITENGVVPE